jgi:hypothetical protein
MRTESHFGWVKRIARSRIRLNGDSELCRLIYCRNFEMAERAFVNHCRRRSLACSH